jgi:hypothetical protein
VLGSRRTRALAIAAAIALALVATSCLPAAPAKGRATPLRRALILGDSITWGLFGTTPRLQDSLVGPLTDRGIAMIIDGFPGDEPLEPWPGQPAWSDRLEHDVAAYDPDVVIVQTMLFPNPDDPARQAAYRTAFSHLLDLASSRGAHVYIVSHPSPVDAAERHARDVAQSLQAAVAAGRGVSTIPLDWWIAHCDHPTIPDGFHLTTSGQRCHALADVAALDQLRATLPR